MCYRPTHTALCQPTHTLFRTITQTLNIDIPWPRNVEGELCSWPTYCRRRGIERYYHPELNMHGRDLFLQKIHLLLIGEKFDHVLNPKSFETFHYFLHSSLHTIVPSIWRSCFVMERISEFNAVKIYISSLSSFILEWASRFPRPFFGGWSLGPVALGCRVSGEAANYLGVRNCLG